MTTEFIVRVANMQDAAGVTALLEASYISQLEGGYSQLVLAKALPLMTRSNPRLLGSGTYYVAQAGTELVGCGGWSKEAPGSGEVKEGIAHIRHVATHPNWLRRGVGRGQLSRVSALRYRYAEPQCSNSPIKEKARRRGRAPRLGS